MGAINKVQCQLENIWNLIIKKLSIGTNVRISFSFFGFHLLMIVGCSSNDSIEILLQSHKHKTIGTIS